MNKYVEENQYHVMRLATPTIVKFINYEKQTTEC